MTHRERLLMLLSALLCLALTAVSLWWFWPGALLTAIATWDLIRFERQARHRR